MNIVYIISYIISSNKIRSDTTSGCTHQLHIQTLCYFQALYLIHMQIIEKAIQGQNSEAIVRTHLERAYE